MTLHRTTKGNARRNRRAFSLAELLIAVLLLSLSVAAMTRMWSISRSLTGKSQGYGESYSVARQEIERDKNTQFSDLFVTTGVSVARVTDYDQTGTPLTTNVANSLSITVSGVLTISSVPSPRAYYRAVSTYALVDTGAETDTASALGVQTVTIYPVNGSVVDRSSPTGVYQTSSFYSTAGI